MMSHRFFRALLSVFIIRVDRRGCSYRPTRMLVTVGADARIGRCGCSYRSVRMLFPMIANHRRVWHPCHTHAATARSHPHAATYTQPPHVATYTQPPSRSHIISRLRGYGRDAIPSYR